MTSLTRTKVWAEIVVSHQSIAESRGRERLPRICGHEVRGPNKVPLPINVTNQSSQQEGKKERKTYATQTLSV